ncbi:hypothetical protein HDU96_011129, partial [Phlyctochytrium bullatum]
QVTRKSDGQVFAARILSKIDESGANRDIRQEIAILKKIRHPGLISMLALYESDSEWYIVTEIARGGELFDWVRERGPFSERGAAEIMRQLLRAVAYLHGKGIVHRDLKPENILIMRSFEEMERMQAETAAADQAKRSSPVIPSRSSSASFGATLVSLPPTPPPEIEPSAFRDDLVRVCISDFGLATEVRHDRQLTHPCGSAAYIAPEALKDVGYGRPADVWALGVIAYVLLCGYQPFWSESQYALFVQVIQGRYEFDERDWSGISDRARAFVSRILVTNPVKRPTAADLLNDPWILETLQPIPTSTTPTPTIRFAPAPEADAEHLEPPPMRGRVRSLKAAFMKFFDPVTAAAAAANTSGVARNATSPPVASGGGVRGG